MKAREVCASPDGKFVYATHLLGHYLLPAGELDLGWIFVNALSVLDARTPAYVNTVLLDNPKAGAANPWGLAVMPDGRKLCVAHAGSQEVTVLDRQGLHQRLERAAKGESVTRVTQSAKDVVTDLIFLDGVRTRIKVKGNGPRGLAIGGGKLFVAEHFSDSVGVIDLEEKEPVAQSLPLGPQPNPSEARRGERLFNDATQCKEQWLSCASCHPDGRAESLNWDLLNDSVGNPKNTKSMLLAHQTPPAMSLGVRKDAETAVRAGFKHIEFTEVPETDARAVDAYLKSLKPVPSPQLVKGRLGSSAMRGRAVFKAAGCAECHPAPLFTSLKAYEVGTTTKKDTDAGKPFDTPTLVEVWRTAPYLHDGRSATLEEVFTRFNPGDRHGRTSKLTKGQLEDLVAYLRSL